MFCCGESPETWQKVAWWTWMNHVTEETSTYINNKNTYTSLADLGGYSRGIVRPGAPCRKACAGTTDHQHCEPLRSRIPVSLAGMNNSVPQSQWHGDISKKSSCYTSRIPALAKQEKFYSGTLSSEWSGPPRRPKEAWPDISGPGKTGRIKGICQESSELNSQPDLCEFAYASQILFECSSCFGPPKYVFFWKKCWHSITKNNLQKFGKHTLTKNRIS